MINLKAYIQLKTMQDNNRLKCALDCLNELYKRAWYSPKFKRYYIGGDEIRKISAKYGGETIINDIRTIMKCRGEI